MATYDAGDVTLRQVEDCVWEMAPEGGMNAPARVLASERLLDEIASDDTLQQLRNATHLPGVTKHAICMPDGHQGYGFPIGGVAAVDAEDGCISPGAVGFDINCLTGESEVLLEFGRHQRLDRLDDAVESDRVVVPADGGATADVHLYTEREADRVFEIETETGERIRATADHPIATPGGMTPLGDLDPGDTIVVHPFRGIEHEPPESFTVLDADDFEDESEQLVRALRDRDLLPLESTDDAFNRLLRLVGFHTGDGTFGGAGQTWFYGESEDLESIRSDIAAIGFTPSRVYSRERTHQVGADPFERTEYSVKATSKAFRKLIVRLGAPTGPKVESTFTTPDYLDRLPDWQRALYLRGFFGAEMSAPAAQSRTNLYCPTVSHNRRSEHADDGRRFMEEICGYLDEMGIETNAIGSFESDYDDETVRFRVGIRNDSETLIRFFETVGFVYNTSKRRAGVEALQYLKYKERVIDRRAQIAREAAALADGGTPVGELRDRYDVNDRFVERSVWSGRSGRPRPPADFPSFDEFRASMSVGDDLTVETEIESIEERDGETVYDIGVDHEAHAFVADSVVVSNCGVRMLRTNLTYDDVRGREEELVDRLFDAVPTGLGGGGVVETDAGTVEAVLERGVEWALDEGYAVPDDLAHCEDGGRFETSDPDAVSDKAKDRGKNQLGSLGSGNHFLEVQRVTDVYRDDVADAYGLAEDRIVVLIHCGSRGLGHQICTEYVREIEEEHADLVDALPDTNLAAAPAGSPLAERYYRAMGAAINFAWVNRQLISHRTRTVFGDVFDADPEALGMDLLYDVAHNIAKRESHAVDGRERDLFVHRKGATRAFPAGRDEVPAAYRGVGQPVIVPGSMGAGTYVLRGGEQSLHRTFGSTAHGAGRLMSRTQAKNDFWGGDVQDDLRGRGVHVKAQSGATIAEEAPGVYKDVDEVVRVSDALGIGDKVARTFPVCNIKG